MNTRDALYTPLPIMYEMLFIADPVVMVMIFQEHSVVNFILK